MNLFKIKYHSKMTNLESLYYRVNVHPRSNFCLSTSTYIFIIKFDSIFYLHYRKLKNRPIVAGRTQERQRI